MTWWGQERLWMGLITVLLSPQWCRSNKNYLLMYKYARVSHRTSLPGSDRARYVVQTILVQMTLDMFTIWCKNVWYCNIDFIQVTYFTGCWRVPMRSRLQRAARSREPLSFMSSLDSERRLNNVWRWAGLVPYDTTELAVWCRASNTGIAVYRILRYSHKSRCRWY